MNARARAGTLAIAYLAAAGFGASAGPMDSSTRPPAPERRIPAAARRSPAPPTPCRKATVPVPVELVVIEGGGAGERTRLALWAEAPREGRLDLSLRLPPGLRLVGGKTAESAAAAGGTRVLEAEVELPAAGVSEVVGVARWSLEGGPVQARAVILRLPEGAPAKPRPLPPRREVSPGRAVIELRGVAP